MIRKKLLAAVLSLLLFSASGCGTDNIQHNPTDFDAQQTTGHPKILCAAFAEYDWARQILGDNPGGIDLTLLNDSGMDMHSYQPSVADMVEIADADLMIFTGGDSEFWIEDALASSADADRHRRSIEMMEIFEHNHEMADRYTADDHSDHGHDHEHEISGDDASHDGHIHSTDEHLWLSLKMAPVFITEIAQAVAALDPANADYYNSNASTYIDSILALDAHYESVAESAGHTTVLFADRYPFKYLLEDYGIAHVAAFPGCSAETEASFETILSLSETIDHLDLGAVVILHKSKPDLAQTIIKNSGNKEADILLLDSMQSVTKSDIAEGATWLSVMEANLEAFRQALK